MRGSRASCRRLARLRSRSRLGSSGLLIAALSYQVGSVVGALRWGGGGACPRDEADQESGIKPPQRSWGTATSVSKMRLRNTRQAGDKLHPHP